MLSSAQNTTGVNGMRILAGAALALLAAHLSNSASANELTDAVKSGDTEAVARALDAGADIDAIDGLGSPLHWAVLNGHPDVVKLLIERGADTEVSTDMLGTPLFAAMPKNQFDIAEQLLDAGADPNARNRDRMTPLHLAARDGRAEIAELLIRSGADVNAVAVVRFGAAVAYGETNALHLAIKFDNPDIAELLRAAGAVPKAIEAADPTDGVPQHGREIAYTYCRECHAFESEDSPPLQPYAGPPLVGVFGRPVAWLPGFDYSDAMRSFGGEWTADRLYTFMRYPMLVVPGTRMTFTKVELTDQDRLDVVAYLASQAQ